MKCAATLGKRGPSVNAWFLEMDGLGRSVCGFGSQVLMMCDITNAQV